MINTETMRARRARRQAVKPGGLWRGGFFRTRLSARRADGRVSYRDHAYACLEERAGSPPSLSVPVMSVHLVPQDIVKDEFIEEVWQWWAHRVRAALAWGCPQARHGRAGVRVIAGDFNINHCETQPETPTCRGRDDIRSSWLRLENGARSDPVGFGQYGDAVWRLHHGPLQLRRQATHAGGRIDFIFAQARACAASADPLRARPGYSDHRYVFARLTAPGGRCTSL